MKRITVFFISFLIISVIIIFYNHQSNVQPKSTTSKKFEQWVQHNKSSKDEEEKINQVHNQFKNSKDKVEALKSALLKKDAVMLHRILTDDSQVVSKIEAKAFIKLVSEDGSTKAFVKDVEDAIQSLEKRHLENDESKIKYGAGLSFFIVYRNSNDASYNDQYTFRLPINTCVIESNLSAKVDYLLQDEIESFTIKENEATKPRQFKVGIVEIPVQMKHDNYMLDGQLKVYSADYCEASLTYDANFLRVSLKGHDTLHDIRISIDGYSHPFDTNYNLYDPVPPNGKVDVFMTGKIDGHKVESNHVNVDFTKVRNLHMHEDSEDENLPMDTKFEFK